jgi:hypothetical protein
MSTPKTRSWQDKVAGGFGNQDVIFANHPLDEKRAKEAIKEARESGASREDFEKEMVWHIYQHVKAVDFLGPHIHDQIKRLHKMWKK